MGEEDPNGHLWRFWNEKAQALSKENAAFRAERDAALAEVERLKNIEAAYSELLATVRGECPSLLNEDSGGSAVLIELVARAAPTVPPDEQKE